MGIFSKFFKGDSTDNEPTATGEAVTEASLAASAVVPTPESLAKGSAPLASPAAPATPPPAASAPAAAATSAPAGSSPARDPHVKVRAAGTGSGIARPTTPQTSPATQPTRVVPVVPAPQRPPRRTTRAETEQDTNPRPHSDSIGTAFEQIMAPSSAPTQGVSTPQDLDAVRKTFHEVAVTHVSQVRDAMLELRFGDADPSWLASTKPALSSLCVMAAHVDLKDLCEALAEFSAMIDTAVAHRSRISDQDKASLLGRYQRLVELIPQAFELDAERDRREPIIIEALLLAIDGVERPTLDRLFAVGLNRLDALTAANAQDVVAVAGIRPALAEAIVAQFQAYRARAKAAVSVRDPAVELSELTELLKSLRAQNAEFSRAASAWDHAAVVRKRELRKQREHTFQRIKVSLARLGAGDQLSKLERLPFEERVEALEIYLSAQSPIR